MRKISNLTHFQKRKINAEKKRLQYEKLKQEDPEKLRAIFKAKRERNLERIRERDRIRKQRKRDANRAKYNREQRKYYHANRERLLEIIIAGRKRRVPHYGLFALLRKFKRGDISLDEFAKQYSEAVERADGRNNRQEEAK